MDDLLHEWDSSNDDGGPADWRTVCGYDVLPSQLVFSFGYKMHKVNCDACILIRFQRKAVCDDS